MKAYRVTHSRGCRTVGDLRGSQSAFRAAGLSRACSVSDVNVCGMRRPQKVALPNEPASAPLGLLEPRPGSNRRRPYAVSIRRLYALAGPDPAYILRGRSSRLCGKPLSPRHRAHEELRRDGRRSAIRGDEADWQPERRCPQGLRRSPPPPPLSSSAKPPPTPLPPHPQPP